MPIKDPETPKKTREAELERRREKYRAKRVPMTAAEIAESRARAGEKRRKMFAEIAAGKLSGDLVSDSKAQWLARIWSDADAAFLRENWQTMAIATIAQKLGKSEVAVSKKARRMRLPAKTPICAQREAIRDEKARVTEQWRLERKQRARMGSEPREAKQPEKPGPDKDAAALIAARKAMKKLPGGLWMRSFIWR